MHTGKKLAFAIILVFPLLPLGEGAMAALLGLDPAAVAEICREASRGEVVSAANLNSPAQTVIAGSRAAVERAVELAKARGAKRAVMLNVSAPFHCALMGPAEERLARDLNALEIRDAEIPLVNNVEARAVRSAAEIRDGLKRQVTAPVLWERSVRALRAEGVVAFIEVGPGKVLSGLLRQIDRDLSSMNVEDFSSANEVAARLGQAG